jgi:hypothetical protein
MPVSRNQAEHCDRLWEKAVEIREGRRCGLWLPIAWHLALRRHPAAMIELADWYSCDNRLSSFGSASNPFCPAGLYHRATRYGHGRASHNAAMSCFNRNDMSGYRRWLRKAAKAGDVAAGLQLGHFELRLPHKNARKVRRIRPEQKRDELA